MAAPYLDTSSPAVTNVSASSPFTLQLNGEITGGMAGKVDEVIYSGWICKRTGKQFTGKSLKFHFSAMYLAIFKNLFWPKQLLNFGLIGERFLAALKLIIRISPHLPSSGDM